MERGRNALSTWATWAITLSITIPIAGHASVAEASPGLIEYRSFSASAAIGPPAEEFARRVAEVTLETLGAAGEVRLVKLAGIPAIPATFGGDIIRAVAAGRDGGGFDAAYVSGGDLNRTWGFLWNSGVPFGPTFDEFVGFLLARSIDGGQRTGIDLVQQTLDARGKGIVAIPIVGSPEQLSGYFPEPMDDVQDGTRLRRGIGLAGLCQRGWTLRYLPPGENVIGTACDDLLARGRIPRKAISFIAAVPGGGSLVEAALAGTLQGFEFATPVDDISQLFNTTHNPGTVGLRYVHVPGWQQQFLITWLVVRRATWDSLSAAQQALVRTVALGHVLSSYADNLRRQGPALQAILGANKTDGNPGNDLVLTRWSMGDQARLRDATARWLNARTTDASLPADDRADYARMLEAFRAYVRAQDAYWDRRQVESGRRFEDWVSPSGECWEDRCDPRRCGSTSR